MEASNAGIAGSRLRAVATVAATNPRSRATVSAAGQKLFFPGLRSSLGRPVATAGRLRDSRSCQTRLRGQKPIQYAMGSTVSGTRVGAHDSAPFLSASSARLLPQPSADDEFRQRGDLQSQIRGAATIIDAARRFGCAHRFIATRDDGVMLFVCECCAHRAELLPLHRGDARGQVIAFTRVAAAARSSRRPRIVRARQTSGLKP